MKYAAWTVLSATTLLLAGCVTPTDGCEAFGPIRPSVSDDLTDETADQILIHNLTGEEVCGWQA